MPDAALHRLRHTVATVLLADGQVLAAQGRLGHADAATTLREYADALPATDTAVADTIDSALYAVTDDETGPSRDRQKPSRPVRP